MKFSRLLIMPAQKSHVIPPASIHGKQRFHTPMSMCSRSQQPSALPSFFVPTSFDRKSSSLPSYASLSAFPCCLYRSFFYIRRLLYELSACWRIYQSNVNCGAHMPPVAPCRLAVVPLGWLAAACLGFCSKAKIKSFLNVRFGPLHQLGA